MVTGDDSSHSQGQSGKRLLLASRGHPIRSVAYQGSCIDPCYLSHTLDPTPDTPGTQSFPTIRLLKKDLLFSRPYELFLTLSCFDEMVFHNTPKSHFISQSNICIMIETFKVFTNPEWLDTILPCAFPCPSKF